VAHETYVPKHRAAPVAKTKAPRSLAVPQAKRILVASGIAAAATGVAVTTGVAGATTGGMQLASAGTSNSAGAKAAAAKIVAERAPAITRSLDRRALARTVKAAALSSTSGPAVTGSVSINPVVAAVKAAVTQGDPKAIALALMPSFGFSTSDFSCIDQIWTQESGWNVHADNPSSGAYGIPQALPGSKMSSAGSDWQTSAATQITWGLQYISGVYGTPCAAWAHSQATNWY
jgi:hypothetical protein